MWASLSMMGASSLPPSLTLSLTLIHSSFLPPHFLRLPLCTRAEGRFNFPPIFFAFLCFHFIYCCNYFRKENSLTIMSAGTEHGWRTVNSAWLLRGRLSSRSVWLLFTAPLLIKFLRRWMCLWKGRLRWEKKKEKKKKRLTRIKVVTQTNFAPLGLFFCLVFNSRCPISGVCHVVHDGGGYIILTALRWYLMGHPCVRASGLPQYSQVTHICLLIGVGMNCECELCSFIPTELNWIFPIWCCFMTRAFVFIVSV